jgi:hypothetical protein
VLALQWASVNLDLTDEETFALLNLLTEAIEADRYPLSPRIRHLRYDRAGDHIVTVTKW